jgi:Fe-S-cluster-containing dehydrogenase component
MLFYYSVEDTIFVTEDGIENLDHDKCILCGYCDASCPVFCLRVV